MVLIPAVLSIFNLYAYFNCSSEQQKNLSDKLKKGQDAALDAGIQYAQDNPDVAMGAMNKAGGGGGMMGFLGGAGKA